MTSQNDSTTPRKKPYEPPSLTIYGRLRDLTAGGTGHANEGSGGMKPRP